MFVLSPVALSSTYPTGITNAHGCDSEWLMLTQSSPIRRAITCMFWRLSCSYCWRKCCSTRDTVDHIPAALQGATWKRPGRRTNPMLPAVVIFPYQVGGHRYWAPFAIRSPAESAGSFRLNVRQVHWPDQEGCYAGETNDANSPTDRTRVSSSGPDRR